MAEQWYVANGSSKKGPFGSEQLAELARNGQLKREDLVWREGMAKWQAASSIRGLFSAIQPPPLPPNTTPSTPKTPLRAAFRGVKLAALIGGGAVLSMIIMCGMCGLLGLALKKEEVVAQNRTEGKMSQVVEMPKETVRPSRSTESKADTTTPDSKATKAIPVLRLSGSDAIDFIDNPAKFKGKTIEMTLEYPVRESFRDSVKNTPNYLIMYPFEGYIPSGSIQFKIQIEVLRSDFEPSFAALPNLQYGEKAKATFICSKGTLTAGNRLVKLSR